MPSESNPTRGTSYRWVVLLVFMFVALLSQLQWLTFAPISKEISPIYHVSEDDVIWLANVWPIVFVVLAIPVGIFIDKRGFVISVRIAAVFLAVFSILRVAAPFLGNNFYVLLIAQVGGAVSQPFIFGSIAKLAVNWFHERERGLATGLGTMGLFLGMMLAYFLIPPLYSAMEMTKMLMILALLSSAGAFLFFVVARERNITETSESESFTLSQLWTLSKNRDFAILEYGFFVTIGGFTAILTWLELMLRSLNSAITVDQAGIIGGMIIIGGIIGSIAVPALSDRYKKIKIFVLIDLLVGTIAFYFIGAIPTYPLLIVTSLIMGFFLMSALPLVLEISNRIAGPGMEGRASSMLWFFSQIGSIILTTMVIPIKDLGNGYMASILVIAVLWVVAFLFFLFLRETKQPSTTP